MFEYIKGDITEVEGNYIVVENGNIGYLINTSKASMMDLGDNLKSRTIYTHLNVREDDISLYGFTTKDELDMFRLLQTVSKIGPRVALGILSTMNTLDIKISLLNEDIGALSKSPGVGKKTAERMILELKDKVHIDENTKVQSKIHTNIDFRLNNSKDEVTEALLSLGYNQSEIFTALNKIDSSEKSTEQLIKETLMELSK